MALAAALTALFLYLHTLAPSITLENGAEDSAELASAAYTLGIAHPTGYPLYTLLGFAVTHLGGGEPAFNLNVFSALMGATTIGLLLYLSIWVARRALPGTPGPLPLVASVVATAALAVSPDFWTEAVVAETRTLALALDATILALLVAPRRPIHRAAPAACFLYGLALSDHLFSLYLAPGLFALILPWARRAPRRWLALLLCLLAGLTPYLYLPLRAAGRPAVNWGDPDTLGRFLWVVSGQEYRYQMFRLDAPGLLAAMGASLVHLWQQLDGATVLAAAVGIAVLARRQARVAVALALSVVADVALTSNYGADAAPDYLLLASLCLVPAAAAGWCAMGQGIVRLLVRLVSPGRVLVAGPLSGGRPAMRGLAAGRVPAAAVCLAIVAGCGLAEIPPVTAARSAVALSASTAERDYGVAVLHSLPPRAVIFASGDETSAPLWYAQHSLGLRPDVTVVATALLTFAWYYKQMRVLPAFDRRLLPDSDLSIDDGADFSLSQARTALLARAIARGRDLFVVEVPDPSLGALCRQLPYGTEQVYRCVR